MAKLERVAGSTPFLKLEPGKYFLVQVIGEHKADTFTAFAIDVFMTGLVGDGIPADDRLDEFFNLTPTRNLLPMNETLVEAFKSAPYNEPNRCIYLIVFHGNVPAKGGRTFNQWDVQRITLDSDIEKLSEEVEANNS